MNPIANVRITNRWMPLMFIGGGSDRLVIYTDRCSRMAIARESAGWAPRLSQRQHIIARPLSRQVARMAAAQWLASWGMLYQPANATIEAVGGWLGRLVRASGCRLVRYGQQWAMSDD